MDMKDQEILGFVERHIEREMVAPTYGEIARSVGLCRRTIRDRVKKLVELGYLDHTPRKHRDIRPGPRLRR
jgi:DNA-binding Lrp family transcriptional regulator